MRVTRALVALAVAVCCTALPHDLGAQDARPALVIGGQSSVGIEWPLSERWAIRPDVNIGGSRQSTSPGSETTTLSVILGASLLQTLTRVDATHTYLVYRLAWNRSRSGDADPTHSYQGLVGLGAHAQATPVIGVFGELGLSLTHASSEFSSVRFKSLSYSSSARIGLTLRRRSSTQ